MSEEANAFSHYNVLMTNKGATAAAVDMVTKACNAGDESSKLRTLNWAIEGDNLKKLRDKIRSCASEKD